MCNSSPFVAICSLDSFTWRKKNIYQISHIEKLISQIISLDYLLLQRLKFRV